MTTTARTCKYREGQAVEVLQTSFEKATWLQKLWMPGIVESVEPAAHGRWTVMVRTGERAWSPQIVGARGGNPNIRLPLHDSPIVPADVFGLSGNQCAAKAYQRFHFDGDQHGALYFVAMAEQLDPVQAARWETLRALYGRTPDPAAPEAAPARGGRRGVL